MTGPRQSGKTTLVRALLPHKPYVSLETPSQREFARARPADFLRQYPGGAVIDEAQHAPELFSQLQSAVDRVASSPMPSATRGSSPPSRTSVRGALFGTMVVNEFAKGQRNAGQRQPLWFWRDNIGTEVDLVFERASEVAAVEIKSGITVAADAFGSLAKWRRYAAERGQFSAVHAGLVYGGEARFVRDGVDVLPWSKL